MGAEIFLAGGIAVLLLGYLVYAMLFPEHF